MKLYRQHIASPWGKLQVVASTEMLMFIGLRATDFDIRYLNKLYGQWHLENTSNQIIKHAEKELEGYFQGRLQRFSIPIPDFTGGFINQVRKYLYEHVEYGKTISYGGIAQALSNPKAARAVGTAMATNPIPIIVPCHRVLPHSGRVGNYGGGSKMKQDLLKIEGLSINL